MTDSGTLSDLIAEANFKLRWFDLGRRVQKVARSTAAAFESGQAPWPHPYLRQAWTGLLLTPEEGGEAIVWFLRLPLDEQAKLQLPIRDAFVRLLTQKLDTRDNDQPAAQLDAALRESGLMFTPAPERQASFHSRIAKLLQRPPSTHLTTALEYVEKPNALRWDQLGLQGIADLAVRWEEHGALLSRQMMELAPPVLISLYQCLESEAIDHRLSERIIERARRELDAETTDMALVAAAVRGISHSPAAGLRQEFLQELCRGISGQNSEVLAAIGSRCVDDLTLPEIATPWLEALASIQNQDTFNLLLADLMYLPSARAGLLSVLRDPQRPPVVAEAFGKFLHGSQPTH